MKKYFVHDRGLCESNDIGAGTKIWAFSHVLPGAKIGAECNVCDHVFIENDVVIGDRVTLKCGVQIWDGVKIGNDVFIGPNVTFTNDKFPRSKQYPDRFLETVIEDGASLGANATILPGLRIGSKAMVGAGSVVTRDVPPNAIVIGNPARIHGYVNIAKKSNLTKSGSSLEQDLREPLRLGVGKSEIWPLPRFRDLRGDIIPVEFESNLPFIPRRQFFVFEVPGHRVRGEHAHRSCDQFLIAINGALSVVVDDCTNAFELRLESPNIGLYIPAGIWGIQYEFSRDAILAVYASEIYNSNDYIRSYDEYKEYISQTKV
ncbi:MAG: WxcM-like domain-containing protein [Dissulfurispiraceae bacterium]|jgi:acetyltransferase-like isoleucine patch superfamily enzyme